MPRKLNLLVKNMSTSEANHNTELTGAQPVLDSTAQTGSAATSAAAKTGAAAAK